MVEFWMVWFGFFVCFLSDFYVWGLFVWVFWIVFEELQKNFVVGQVFDRNIVNTVISVQSRVTE